MQQMTRAILLAAGVAAAALTAPGPVRADTGWSPPGVQEAEDGWQEYVDPARIDSAAARGLKPALDTPEGAVMRYLASRLRDDRDWKSAMVDDPDRKAKKALKKWRDWTLNAAQLKARKFRGENRAYVSVWMDFTISGDNDSGTDDFTVVRQGDEWRVASPPS